jgi:hypothetical protein
MDEGASPPAGWNAFRRARSTAPAAFRATSRLLLREFFEARGSAPPARLVNDLFRGGRKSWLFCNNGWGSHCRGGPMHTLSVERGKPMSNVGIEEGAAEPRLFHQGDGAGNAVLQQKYPDPYFNF